MKKKWQLELAGQWNLCGRPEDGSTAPERFERDVLRLECPVPGNIESALCAAGVVPDPYVAMNAQLLRPYEFYEWRLEREFEYDGVARRIDWVFEGLDCCATVLVNGVEAGTAENALIEQRFDIGAWLRPGVNRLTVMLASANNVFRRYPMEACSMSAYPYNYESIRIRKPAHVWGWDITPRMALGGIFRAVRLEEIPANRLEDGFLQLCRLNGDQVDMAYHYKLAIARYEFKDLRLTLDATAGADATWHAEQAVWSAMGVVRFTLDRPKLWWPRGYGEPALYEVTVRLIEGDGQVLFEHRFTAGIRKVELIANPVWTEKSTPDFLFKVNNEPIMIKGCNHVPADALHANDEARLPKILDMAADLNCNMLRLWGGGIYESELFYDRCDREGILIWHDFMMGCAVYPQDEDFRTVMRREAEAVVRRLRQHPSIALWAGDNECDAVPFWGLRFDPNRNRITREVFPEVCLRLDPTRPYLASSPWYAPEAVAEAARIDPDSDPMFRAAEQHLWGPRDYFKSDFYRNTRASFASEIGYHGCPNVSSIRRFVDPEFLWPYADNRQWDYHASNPFHQDHDFLNYRTYLMADQIKEMFGQIPETLEEYAVASQICQAEAKKYFIELVRSRPKMSGILWWNLIDCWPQFSDAVVDYYFSRKLAYHFIKRVQRDLAVLVTEAANWRQRVMVANDGRDTRRGRCRVWDHDTGEVICEKDFVVAPNARTQIAEFKVCTTSQRLLLIRWELEDGTVGVNHCVCGQPQYDLERFRRDWLPAIAALDGSFDPLQVGQ